MKTSFAIIETLHDHQPLRLIEIAERVNIANSTAHEHLSTLADHGYVIERDKGYYLSLKFVEYGKQATAYFQELLKASQPSLAQLVNETDETVNLVVEEHGLAVYIDRRTGQRGVPTNSWVGKRKFLHTLSAGKAILAHLPDERVDEILETTNHPAVTAHTITSHEALRSECESIRERGIAFNDRESHEQIRAVGAPIIVNDDVYGAVSVAGPAKRLTDDYYQTELPDLLLGVVNEIELKLAHSQNR